MKSNTDEMREAFENVEKRMNDAAPYREVWSDEFKVIDYLRHICETLHTCLHNPKSEGMMEYAHELIHGAIGSTEPDSVHSNRILRQQIKELQAALSSQPQKREPWCHKCGGENVVQSYSDAIVKIRHLETELVSQPRITEEEIAAIVMLHCGDLRGRRVNIMDAEGVARALIAKLPHIVQQKTEGK